MPEEKEKLVTVKALRTCNIDGVHINKDETAQIQESRVKSVAHLVEVVKP